MSKQEFSSKGFREMVGRLGSRKTHRPGSNQEAIEEKEVI